MQAKDITEGEEYLIVRHYSRAMKIQRGEFEGQWDFGRLAFTAMRGVALEKGVRIRYIDAWDPNVESSKRRIGDEDVVDAIQFIMPWAAFNSAYHAAQEEGERREAEERVRRHKAEIEQEEFYAQRWMTDNFEHAKSNLEEMVELGLIAGFTDAEIRALVDLRYPEGNPHLKKLEALQQKTED